jgi:DNA helicase-2/ATP-dependent DNA helicase PcrA
VYNAQRTRRKKPLIAGKTELKYPRSEHIQLRVFETDEDEASGIPEAIPKRDRSVWGETAVLARTRALLQRMHKALQEREVPSVIAQRRDDFLSAEFRWFVASLRQIARPLDRRNLAVLVEAFNRLAETAVSVEQVNTDAEATGRSYFTTWLEAAERQSLTCSQKAAYTGGSRGR